MRMIILCQNGPDAKSALTLVQQWMLVHELKLHPTHLGNCLVQGFEFLGYRFENGKHYIRPTQSIKR